MTTHGTDRPQPQTLIWLRARMCEIAHSSHDTGASLSLSRSGSAFQYCHDRFRRSCQRASKSAGAGSRTGQPRLWPGRVIVLCLAASGTGGLCFDRWVYAACTAQLESSLVHLWPGVDIALFMMASSAGGCMARGWVKERSWIWIVSSAMAA